MTQSNQVRISVTKLDGSLWDYAAVSPPSDGEIHVWEFCSEMADWPREDVAALLSADERERAARFHFQRDTQRFSVTRARMRSILGMYVRSDSHELKFSYAERGKPSLQMKTDLLFNVSHSGDRAVLAIASAREVGVDIEQIRDNVECEQLAERFFSPGERRLIRELDENQKLTAFFRLWTCKEAFLKAHGAGLSRSLSSFEVHLGSAPGQLLRVRGDAEEERRWSLVELEPPAPYASAAVVDGIIENVRVFRLE